MSEFTDVIRESTEKKTSQSTLTRGSDYVKLTNEHPTVIRILDSKPIISWTHFVKGHSAFPNANAGKGMSFTCLGKKECPVCQWNAKQEAKAKNRIGSRRVYTFNVLERTPVVKCPDCGAEHYSVKGNYPEDCQNPDCSASLLDIDAEPLDKIKIMQKGVTIANQFISLEEEFGEVTEYDIKMDTRGVGDQVSTTCVPKPQTTLNLEEIIGPDWREQLFDIVSLTSPKSVDDINRILAGEDFYTVFGKKD